MSVSTVTSTTSRWSALRLRQTAHLRDLCAETSFTTAHLVQPIFVVEGLAGSEAIPGLDGNYRFGIDSVMDVIGADVADGRSPFPAFCRSGEIIADRIRRLRRPRRRRDQARVLARTSTCGSISACARARTMATARISDADDAHRP